MKLFVTHATGVDVLEVIADMSRQTAADIKALGLSAEDTLKFFTSRVPERDAMVFMSLLYPVAVLGWDKTPLAWYSWLIVTQGGYSSDSTLTLAIRRQLRAVQQANPKVELRCIANSDTEKVQRWFKCLGCEKADRFGMKVWIFRG